MSRQRKKHPASVQRKKMRRDYINNMNSKGYVSCTPPRDRLDRKLRRQLKVPTYRLIFITKHPQDTPQFIKI